MSKEISYLSRYYQGESWKSVKEEFGTPSAYASRLFTDIRYQENDKAIRGVDLENWVKENKERYPELNKELEFLEEKRENLYRTRLTSDPVNDEHFQDQLYYVMKYAKSHIEFNQEVQKVLERDREVVAKFDQEKEFKNEYEFPHINSLAKNQKELDELNRADKELTNDLDTKVDLSSILAQSSRPSEAQINSSAKADVDNDARFGDITNIGEIPSELINKLDDLKGIQNGDIGKIGYTKLMFHVLDKTLESRDEELKNDIKRNFTEHLNKALNNSTLNIPEELKDSLEKENERRRQEREREEVKRDYPKQTINIFR